MASSAFFGGFGGAISTNWIGCTVASAIFSSLGFFGNKNNYCTIYIISKVINLENLDSEIFQLLKTKNLMSCSQLPNNSGIVIRILSDSIDEIEDVISAVREIVRKLVPKTTMKITSKV